LTTNREKNRYVVLSAMWRRDRATALEMLAKAKLAEERVESQRAQNQKKISEIEASLKDPFEDAVVDAGRLSSNLAFGSRTRGLLRTLRKQQKVLDEDALEASQRVREAMDAVARAQKALSILKSK
jgi:hypothetical protein